MVLKKPVKSFQDKLKFSDSDEDDEITEMLRAHNERIRQHKPVKVLPSSQPPAVKVAGKRMSFAPLLVQKTGNTDFSIRKSAGIVEPSKCRSNPNSPVISASEGPSSNNDKLRPNPASANVKPGPCSVKSGSQKVDSSKRRNIPPASSSSSDPGGAKKVVNKLKQSRMGSINHIVGSGVSRGGSGVSKVGTGSSRTGSGISRDVLPKPTASKKQSSLPSSSKSSTVTLKSKNTLPNKQISNTVNANLKKQSPISRIASSGESSSTTSSKKLPGKLPAPQPAKVLAKNPRKSTAVPHRPSASTQNAASASTQLLRDRLDCPFAASVMSIINTKTPGKTHGPVTDRKPYRSRYSIESPSPQREDSDSEDLDSIILEKLKAHNAKLEAKSIYRNRIPGKVSKVGPVKPVSLHLGSPARPKARPMKSCRPSTSFGRKLGT